MAKTDKGNTKGMPKNSGRGAKPESGKQTAGSAASKSTSKTTSSKATASKDAATASDKQASTVNRGSADPMMGSDAKETLDSTLQHENFESDVPSDGDEFLTAEELTAERDKYLRLAAEYDNYRKRSAKEREMTYSDARIESITKLLPIYDNLERALQMECADEAFYKGIEMIRTQFNEMFESMGVKHIPALGEPFDPKLHNAVMMITDPNLGVNTIAEEYQKGFTLGQRVIRFSTVVVAN
ncbi:MAG: nucleotide exchange factor GrpE [Oscillospiraceae bacterium]|nr:nucleotide exchange factor GrpE [Oscillospiraceae bacterium]MCL2279095.1 nucleotide exchange factor GrpE [Oscillospiraceae bacterium]